MSYRALVRLALVRASDQNRLGFEPRAVPEMAIVGGVPRREYEWRQAMAQEGEDPPAAEAVRLCAIDWAAFVRWCGGAIAAAG